MNKLGYWLIQLTWGLLTTLLGLLLAVTLKACGFKHYKNGHSIIIKVGRNWGGLSLGAFSFCEDDCDFEFYEHTRRHEYGHSIQNMIFGPFWILLVGIPSFIRYWYFTLTPNLEHKEYDDIWFEHTATVWGTRAINKIEKEPSEYEYSKS